MDSRPRRKIRCCAHRKIKRSPDVRRRGRPYRRQIPAQEAIMRRHRRVVASALAAALSLFLAPSAFAASGVFGGTTDVGEAIVLKTDAKAKKLRSAVITWRAECADGRYFPFGAELTAVANEPGFTPSPDELLTSKNAKGRFAGTQMAGMDLGEMVALISVELSGKIRSGRASGRLRGTVSVLDKATGAESTTCETGSLKWSASRDAGRIYGGKTSQDQPVVVRLNRKGKRVADLIVAWESSTCEPPDSFLRIPESFTGFAIRSRSFSGSFDDTVQTDDGGRVAFAYNVAGKVSRRSITGTLTVNVTGTDAAGATDLTCDTGAVSWRTSTG
jgi:hypothetical protein